MERYTIRSTIQCSFWQQLDPLAMSCQMRQSSVVVVGRWSDEILVNNSAGLLWETAGARDQRKGTEHRCTGVEVRL